MTINDKLFLALNQYTGTLNDKLFSYLRAKGHTGTLNGMLRQNGGWFQTRDGLINEKCFALNFDGVNTFGQFANRLINPDGDIEIEFWTPSSVAAGTQRVILSQAVATDQAAKEFELFIPSSTGNLGVTLGGATSAPLLASELLPATKYRFRYVGNQMTTTNLATGVTVTRTLTRGSAREPTAVTRLGSSGIGTSFYIGLMPDIKINGIYYPLDSRSQAVQLAQPNGLGAELLNNPQFSNNAAGWTLVSGGAVTNNQAVARLENTTNSAGRLAQDIVTAPGVVYALRITYLNGFQLRVSVADGGVSSYTGNLLFNNISTAEKGVNKFFVFTAVSNRTTVSFICNSSLAGSFTEFTLAEVKPLGTANPLVINNFVEAQWEEVPCSVRS